MATKTCMECGRTYSYDMDVMGGYKTEGYCSEGCRAAARKRSREEAERRREEKLRLWREKGKKTLEKWEKELEKWKKAQGKESEKRKSRMAKLSEAIRSDDPNVIVKAIKGGFFKRFIKGCGCLIKAVLIVGATILMIAGLLSFLRMKENFLSARDEAHRILEQSKNSNAQPPLENTLGTTNTVGELRDTPAESAVASVEGDSTPTAK